jgi:murein DD-endopeptidase MepM/ murein hydrolase activator NlpD
MPLLLIAALLIFSFAPVAQPDPIDQAVAARLEAEQIREGTPYFYRTVGRTVDSETGGVIYAEVINAATGEVYPGLIDLIVVVPENGVWSVYIPGDALYTSAFNLLTPPIVSQIDARPYKPPADPDLPDPSSLRSYRYPWENGIWGTVTRSFSRHGLGQIDFDISGRGVVAMKDGVIVYANDTRITNAYNEGAWWYWNTIVIQHGEGEYALYGHLDTNSIPDWIKAGCTADYSASNCNVPVEEGEIIAFEGNTGYSSNPHLHIEFGQQFGVAAYRDTRDSDSDGDRVEAVYAAYMYMEQNASFRGYSPREVADWPYGTQMQAYHGASAPAGVNLIGNGDFSAGTGEWSPSGQISWSADDGTMHILRLNTADPPDWASFYQNLDYGADAFTPFEVVLQLGNTSGNEKTVTVALRNAAGIQYGAIRCDFQLGAGSGLQTYTMRGVTNASWALARLEIFVNPPDSAPAALIDNITVQRLNDDTVTETQCI